MLGLVSRLAGVGWVIQIEFRRFFFISPMDHVHSMIGTIFIRLLFAHLMLGIANICVIATVIIAFTGHCCYRTCWANRFGIAWYSCVIMINTVTIVSATNRIIWWRAGVTMSTTFFYTHDYQIDQWHMQDRHNTCRRLHKSRPPWGKAHIVCSCYTINHHHKVRRCTAAPYHYIQRINHSHTS